MRVRPSTASLEHETAKEHLRWKPHTQMYVYIEDIQTRNNFPLVQGLTLGGPQSNWIYPTKSREERKGFLFLWGEKRRALLSIYILSKKGTLISKTSTIIFVFVSHNYCLFLLSGFNFAVRCRVCHFQTYTIYLLQKIRSQSPKVDVTMEIGKSFTSKWRSSRSTTVALFLTCRLLEVPKLP